MRPSRLRSTSSAMAPNATQKPSSRPSGASEIDAPDQREDQDGDEHRQRRRAGQPLRHRDEIAALPGQERPERQTISSGAISAPKVRLKNGAPTEMVLPVIASSSSG